MFAWFFRGRSAYITFIFPPEDQLTPVAGWSQLLLTANYIELARRSKVKKLVHLKSKDGFRHEYVKIHLEARLDDHCTRKVVVVIDRNPGEYAPQEPGAAGVSEGEDMLSGGSQLPGETKSCRSKKSVLKSKSSSINSLASSLTSLTSSSRSSAKGGRSATDQVVIPAFGDDKRLPKILKDDTEEVRTLELPKDEHFSLAHFAALLPIISAYKDQYHPLHSQCYWYILAIYSVVHDRWPHSKEDVGDAYSERGRFMKWGVTTELKPKHFQDIKDRWNTVIEALAEEKSTVEVSVLLFVFGTTINVHIK
jgi:hypothetical protein